MTTTPLGEELVAMIEAEGPIGIDRFMALALGHPRYGYYMTRDPFGRAGDFVTAPEISQIFGELIGLFAAVSWQMMGSPSEVALVELGPGRGTLMADMLRAARALPEFTEALSVHLVEMSPVLQRAQAQTLTESGITPQWHASVDTLLDDVPVIIIANEFFDALPIRQFQRIEGAWRERVVGLTAARELGIGLDGQDVNELPFAAEPGTIFEMSAVALDAMRKIATMITAQGGLCLTIDYGHAKSGFGDTLQAVHQHRFVPVLHQPGEADLTAHVDFSALGIAAHRAGAAVHPLLTQAAFLDRMGIQHRAEILKKRADDPKEIDLAVARLAGVGEAQMGHLFKVLAITSQGFGPPPGFDQDDPRLAGQS